MSTTWQGLWPACPTPITTDEKLDTDALRRLVAALLAGGADGLWMFGSGGEGLTLSDEVRRQALEVTVAEAGAGFPILAGITAEGTGRSLERYQAIADLPIDGVFAIPPIYYGYDQDELIGYFTTVARETGRPVFLYHNPFFGKSRMTIDTVVELSALPGIAGMKDSTKDIAETQSLIWRTDGDFAVFQGHEELIAASVLAGADGVVSVVSSVAPRLFADLVAAARAGAVADAYRLQRAVTELLGEIGIATARTEGDFIRAVKGRLVAQGLCGPAMTAPWRPAR